MNVETEIDLRPAYPEQLITRRIAGSVWAAGLPLVIEAMQKAVDDWHPTPWGEHDDDRVQLSEFRSVIATAKDVGLRVRALR